MGGALLQDALARKRCGRERPREDRRRKCEAVEVRARGRYRRDRYRAARVAGRSARRLRRARRRFIRKPRKDEDARNGSPKPNGARRSANPPPACRAGRRSGTVGSSTNFQVRTEVVFYGRLHAAELGCAVRDSAGSAQMVVVPATSTRATTAIDSKGQFHGTSRRTGGSACRSGNGRRLSGGY